MKAMKGAIISRIGNDQTPMHSKPVTCQHLLSPLLIPQLAQLGVIMG